MTKTPHKTKDICHNETPDPVLGMPLTRVDALLPTNLLQGDEVVIMLLKPSLWYIVLACLEVIVFLGIMLGLTVWFAPFLHDKFNFAIDIRNLAILLIAIGMMRISWQFLQWIASIYVLTDRRIIRVQNFFRPEIFETQLSRLQHTELLISMRERFFGLGTIAFATAGSAIPEAYWLMIRQPLEIHRKIVQAINRANGSNGTR